MPLFGTDAIINHMTLIFGALFALGGLIFRKSVANDLLDMKFSFIGCMIGFCLSFIILDNTFHILKLTVVVSLICWIVGGFGLGPFLWDGEAEGME